MMLWLLCSLLSEKCLAPSHTPSIAFRHLPPNSDRFGYATKGALFISAQLSTDAVSALRNVWVLIKLQALVYDILTATTAIFSYAIGPRKLSANEQTTFLPHSEHHFPAPSSKLCQNTGYATEGSTLYRRAGIHRRCHRPPNCLGTNKTVEET